MRYLFRLLCVCALVSLPQSTSAQAGEEGATSEPKLQEPAPPAEPALEEPALQLELNDDSVKLAPGQPRTADGYTLEQMEARVKRAKIGLGGSSGVFLAGGVMAGIALSQATPLVCILDDCPLTPEWAAPVGWTGVLLLWGGLTDGGY
jgi:hypothetical protein